MRLRYAIVAGLLAVAAVALWLAADAVKRASAPVDLSAGVAAHARNAPLGVAEGPAWRFTTVALPTAAPPAAPVKSPARSVAQSLAGTWQLQRSSAGDPDQLGSSWSDAKVPGHLYQQAEPYAWYRRTFDVPADWRGAHVFLCFGGVKFVSEVYVNGQHVGGHFGGWEPFEVDVTSACQFGAANELLVRVKDVRGVIEGEVAYQAGNMVESVTGRVMAPVGSQPGLFGIWQDVQLVARGDVYVSDVTVVTSVRNHRISVTYELTNLGAAAHDVTVSAQAMDGAEAALDLGSADAAVPAGGTAQVVLTQPWADPVLWQPDHPQLYEIETTVTQGGQTADAVTTRFGFREFWTDGATMCLNGTPIKFLASAGHPPWNGALLSDEEVRAKLEEIRTANVMAFRLHANIWPDNWYDAADEIGMPVLLESAIWCYSWHYALPNPQFWQNCRDHWAAVIKAHKNHPSVVIYSIENEILHCGGKSHAAGTEVQLGNLGRYVKGLDPTRPITYDGDEDPDGAADIVNLHYPHEWPTNTDFPNTCYWLQQPTVVEGWPYRLWEWDRRKPLYMGEFLWVFTRSNHAWSSFVGDDAYVNYEVARAAAKAIAWEMQTEAYRMDGVNGMCPWTVWESGEFPNDQYLAVQRAYEPNAAFVKEYDRRFFSGKSVNRTLVLFNDTLHPATLTLRWDLDGGVQGSQQFTLQPTETAQAAISLHMPAVSEVTEVSFNVSVLDGGGTVYSRSRSYQVFPRRAPQFGLPEGATVAVYEGSGAAAAFLRRGGVSPLLLTDLEQVRGADPDVLVIGAHALDVPAGQAGAHVVGGGPAAALADYVADGGVVIVLEQDAYPTGLVPASLVGESATVGFLRADVPAVTGGLREDAFSYWRGDHYVTHNALARPQRGGFRVMADAGSPNGLTRVLLAEVIQGKGRFILSQTPLVGKLDSEPLANLLLERLVTYAASAPVARKPAAILTGACTPSADLAAVGAECDDVTGSLGTADLSGYGVLIADGASPELVAQRARVQQFVRGGGVAVLHALDNATAQQLADVLPEEVTVRANLHAPVIYNRTGDPVENGLANEDLFWVLDWGGDWDDLVGPSPKVLHGEVMSAAPSLAECTVFECEAMTPPDPGAGTVADSEVFLWAGGSIQTGITLPSAGSYFFGVVGHGTPCHGIYPEVTVYLDGRAVGSLTVGADADTYWFVADATAGAHALRLAFSNDTWAPEIGEDRNVWLDKFFYAERTSGPALALTSPAGLVKIADGAGYWLIDEVDWDGRVGSLAYASRYLCGLLTNLGVAFSAQGGTSIPGSGFAAEYDFPNFGHDGDVAYMGSQGVIGTDVEFRRAGACEVTVTARGTIGAGEYPIVDLYLDQAVVSSQQLQSAEWRDLTFTCNVTAGVHRIGLGFPNDYWNPDAGEDRNLWIRGVRIRLLSAAGVPPFVADTQGIKSKDAAGLR